MQKNPQSINLLRRQANVVERFLSWSLTIGRLVVILTEVIALGAFIYRFSLDSQLIDLHSKISQEQTVVNYLKDSEATYRNLQDRLTNAAKFSDLGTARFKAYMDIASFAPRGLAFTNLSLFEDRVRIEANIDSINSLNTFVNSLKKYPSIDTISIDKIQSRPAEAVIAVTITANFKPSLIYANTN
jgi:hypothetical protein